MCKQKYTQCISHLFLYYSTIKFMVPLSNYSNAIHELSPLLHLHTNGFVSLEDTHELIHRSQTLTKANISNTTDIKEITDYLGS